MVIYFIVFFVGGNFFGYEYFKVVFMEMIIFLDCFLFWEDGIVVWLVLGVLSLGEYVIRV